MKQSTIDALEGIERLTKEIATANEKLKLGTVKAENVAWWVSKHSTELLEFCRKALLIADDSECHE